MNGSSNEKQLTDIMLDFTEAKADLSLHIQQANVGLTRTANESIVVNAGTIKRLDSLFRSVVDGENRQHLEMARLVANRPIRDDGTVALNEADILRLRLTSSNHPTPVNTIEFTLPVRFSVVVNNLTFPIDNLSKRQALQLIGPRGGSEWNEVSSITSHHKAGSGVGRIRKK